MYQNERDKKCNEKPLKQLCDRQTDQQTDRLRDQQTDKQTNQQVLIDALNPSKCLKNV